MSKEQWKKGIDELNGPQLHNKRTDILILFKESKTKEKGLDAEKKYRTQLEYINQVIRERIYGNLKSV